MNILNVIIGNRTLLLYNSEETHEKYFGILTRLQIVLRHYVLPSVVACEEWNEELGTEER